MGILEIIMAIILIIACVFIVVVVLMQETKTQMSQTISGSSSDNFYQKNSGRTREAMLNKATIAAAITFFVLALAVNLVNLHFGTNDSTSSGSSDTNSQIEDYIEDTGVEDTTVSEIIVSSADSAADTGSDATVSTEAAE